MREVLVWVWWASFLLCVVLLIVLYALRWIEADNLTLGIQRIGELYLPYIGVISAFYFAQGRVTERAPAAGTAGAIALAASLLWNLGLVGSMALVLLTVHSIEQSLVMMGTWALACSVFVAPALGAWFGKREPGG
jgi:hypothetical protein